MRGSEPIYAQGWLLNHYLAFEPSRKGQIEHYVTRHLSPAKRRSLPPQALLATSGKLEGELEGTTIRHKQLPFED